MIPVSKQHSQAGFTLIEVLVAALVLGIGLVGVAGLQAVTLKNNQSTFMRSQATALAYDLADRMRANVPGAVAGAYDVDPASATLTAACGTVTGCSAANLAENDLAEWAAMIETYLPSGEGLVCIDSTPDDGTGSGTAQCDGSGAQFAIKIWWDDDRDGSTTVTDINNERLAISFQL